MDTQPWSAVDADPMTAWRPAPWSEDPQPAWWKVTADRAFLASTVVVSLGGEPGVPRPSELRLTTDTGSVVVPVADTGEEQVLPLPEGYTSQLTISSTTPGNAEDAPAFALAEVRILGMTVHRSTVTPPVAGPASVYAFEADRGRPGCVTGGDGAPLCAAPLVTGSEEAVWLDRTFFVTDWTEYQVFGTATARPGRALDELLTSVRGTVTVEATSEPVTDPRASAAAAVDGDPTTAWLAAGDDVRPTLVLTFPEPRTIDSLRVVPTERQAGAAPEAVTIEAGGLPRTLRLTEDGTVRFTPITTDRLSVTFEVPDDLQSLDPATRWNQQLGVGIAEIEVGQPNPVTPPETPVVTECGTGPEVRLDGTLYLTSVRSTVGALQTLQPLALEFCEPATAPTLKIPGGEHRVLARSNEAFAIESVALSRTGAGAATAPGQRGAVETTRWEAEHRTVQLAARDEETLLVIPENTNHRGGRRAWTASRSPPSPSTAGSRATSSRPVPPPRSSSPSPPAPRTGRRWRSAPARCCCSSCSPSCLPGSGPTAPAGSGCPGWAPASRRCWPRPSSSARRCSVPRWSAGWWASGRWPDSGCCGS
nr:discoidin domain-containing protein [Blastococcus sp. TML/M2B]